MVLPVSTVLVESPVAAHQRRLPRLPVRDLVGMKIELLGQLGQRPVATDVVAVTNFFDVREAISYLIRRFQKLFERLRARSTDRRNGSRLRLRLQAKSEFHEGLNLWRTLPAFWINDP